jgi:cell division protein FtsB
LPGTSLSSVVNSDIRIEADSSTSRGKKKVLKEREREKERKKNTYLYRRYLFIVFIIGKGMLRGANYIKDFYNNQQKIALFNQSDCFVLNLKF